MARLFNSLSDRPRADQKTSACYIISQVIHSQFRTSFCALTDRRTRTFCCVAVEIMSYLKIYSDAQLGRSR